MLMVTSVTSDAAHCLTTCTSAAGTARVLNVLTGVARAPARDGPVSSKCGLGGTPERAARICPGRPAGGCWARAGQPPSGNSVFHTLIYTASRGPRTGGRAGPTERRPEPNDWDVGQAHGLTRQPPGASLPKANMALAPGGTELPRWRWVPISGPPPISGGPPADAGTPNTEAGATSQGSRAGQFKHHSCCGGERWGFCLTTCASAAGPAEAAADL